MTEKEINEFADGLEYTNGIYGFKQGVKLQKQKQDEFAIGFGDWLNNGRFSQYGDSWIDPRKNKDKDGDWLFFSSKQLLEIYKKEKGL